MFCSARAGVDSFTVDIPRRNRIKSNNTLIRLLFILLNSRIKKIDLPRVAAVPISIRSRGHPSFPPKSNLFFYSLLPPRRSKLHLAAVDTPSSKRNWPVLSSTASTSSNPSRFWTITKHPIGSLSASLLSTSVFSGNWENILLVLPFSCCGHSIGARRLGHACPNEPPTT